MAFSGFSLVPLQGSVLIFEPSSGSFSSGATLSQDYGDNIAATIQDGFAYGSDYGFTPNVSVEYGGGPDPVDGYAVFWGPDFGDLDNVVEAESEPNGLQIRLVAEPGYQVALHGFDLAGWPEADYTINAVRVRGSDDAILFESLNTFIAGAGPAHTSFDFATAWLSSTIKIEWDSSNLGGSSDNIGIDNISFSQVAIPEPATALFAGLIGLGVGVVRSRRQSA
ncbi:MAG: hypothetical protein ACFE0O_02415 [Opitutales bacterium]